ncbi:MAG: hypothetical protein AB7F96_17270 [Beijerinckiaceae bacterium]
MVRMSIAAGIAVATAAFLAAPVAEAARCPSGQIWRVSKKTCMNKAAAIKAGIFKARKGKKAAKTVHTRRAPPPPARPVVEKAESERPSIAAPAGTIQAAPAQIAPAPVSTVPPAVEASGPGKDLKADNIAPAKPLGSAPLPTRFVKAQYYTASGYGQAPRPVQADSTRGLQLDLLQNMLKKHVEKNREKYTKRALP